MARAKAAPPPKSGAAQAAPGSKLWLHGMICGALVSLATPIALLLGVLLLPGLVSFGLERTPGRPVTRAVMLCGLAATISPLRSLWDDGQTLAGSLALASEPATVALAWGTAGAGWLICEIAPLVIAGVMERLSAARAVKLRAARARLVEEWGFAERTEPEGQTTPHEKGPQSGVPG